MKLNFNNFVPAFCSFVTIIFNYFFVEISLIQKDGLLMIDKICNFLMKRVKQKMPEVDEERAEVIRYGFELIIGEVPKMILIFIIAALLGKLKYFLISIAIVCPYRIFSGGIHFKTHIGCLISTALLYLGNVFFCEWFSFSNLYIKLIFAIGVYIFSTIMIILYAPADTDTVPILIKRDRKIAKVKAIIWVTIIVSLSFVFKNMTISNLCIFGVLFQTLTIMKISYRIFNIKLGYLEYEKSL